MADVAIPDPRPADLRVKDDLRTPALVGVLGLGGMMAALVVWAKVTMISGAVIAHGQAVVHGKPKLIQTLQGGEIMAVNVQNGDHVTAGEVLVTLDPTLAEVNLGIARARLAEALARAARLRAEQSGLPAPDFRYGTFPFALPDTRAEEAGQAQVFQARAEVIRGKRDRLAETRAQHQAEIQGFQSRSDAVQRQIDLVEADLADIRTLVAQGLARQSQQSDLERTLADLKGQIATLSADTARTRAAMRDAEIETLQEERAFRESVVTELREVTVSLEELTLDIVNREADLRRMKIAAPVEGVVHNLEQAMAGGVLAPGATIMEIVPAAAGVDFEVKVDPRAIDQVHPGQAVRMTFSALPRNSTPVIEGTVASVSADAIVDPVTRQSYFRAVIDVPPAELARIEDAQIVPGMPIDAHLQTGDRSVLSYLLKPLSDHLNGAFREE